MTKTEHNAMSRLIASIEDPVQVRKAFVAPSGKTREFTNGYVAGAQMQAKSLAMALRGICGIKKEDEE